MACLWTQRTLDVQEQAHVEDLVLIWTFSIIYMRHGNLSVHRKSHSAKATLVYHLMFCLFRQDMKLLYLKCVCVSSPSQTSSAWWVWGWWYYVTFVAQPNSQTTDCIWKFPCGFHTSNSAHYGSGSCCTQEVMRNRIPGWRRHVTAVTPELQHTSLLMCEGSITSCSFSYKCKTWTDSWLGKGNIFHLDMGIKLVPDRSIHWTCIPQNLSEYLLSVLVCVWGFCVCFFVHS